MMDRLLQQARHEYSANQRTVALLLLAPIFLFVLPYLFIRLGGKLDQWLQWPPILSLPYNLILGGLLILPSWLLGMWGKNAILDTPLLEPSVVSAHSILPCT